MADGGFVRIGRRATVRWVTGALVLLALALGASWGLWASTALASETIINFDGLSAGTTVTSQYASVGLEFGEAKSFGQTPPPNGDCGPPKIVEAPATALSPSNYAVLGRCPLAAPFSGTYGSLTKHPRGSLSVHVRAFGASPSNPELKLTGYSATGVPIAQGTATAVTTGWTLLTAKQEGGTNEPIAYFSLSTEAIDNGEIGIDDLGFETVVESGTETTPTGSTPPPPAPPVAGITLTTPNPTPGSLVALSGASSTPGSGRIISYDWDLNGDGKIDTSTGTNPIVHLVLAPGVHEIGLTVTNSNGQSSSNKFGLGIPTAGSVLHPPDGGEGPCEPTLQVGDAQLIAECIQKTASGYVIATKQLGLNGMVLSPLSGGFEILKVQTVKDIAIAGSRTLLSGSAVSLQLLNTPIGDVVLGSRELESEPIQLDAHSNLNNKLTIPINHSLRGPRGRAADEGASKTLLLAVGVGHECTSKESKKAGCCPPAHENTACATLPGNFPLVGQVVVYLTNKGQALIDVQVGLELKGIFEATGALEIEADPQAGINLNSLKFTIPEAGLEGIFTVKKASFAYYFPSAPEESKRDTWQAEGEIVFGPLGEPSLEAALAFKKGQFHSASLVFGAPPPGIPIYPAIFLNKLGGSVGVEPFSFGGVLGAKIAASLELTLSFKYREASGEELGFFGGQGQLELGDDKIATLAADVYSDGYVDAQLNINLKVPFGGENPIVSVGGMIGFWDEPKSGLWQAEGEVFLKLWEIRAEVAGLVNNEYIAGCAAVDGFGVQGRFKFADSSVGGGLFGFSNCSDQLKQYKEQPLVKHSGGFVGGESLRFRHTRAGAAAIPPTRASAAAGEGDTFTLPAGQFGEELRLGSASGAPVLTLTSPGGQTYTTPTAGHIVAVAGQFIAAVAPDGNHVLVLLAHPQGGTWRVQANAGSPPLSTLEVAGDVPPASVRTHVTRGHGAHWRLAYRIAHFVPGTGVRFVERGRDSTHVLGTVHSATGSIAFVPQDALGRQRRIVAYLLDGEGAPQRVLAVGRYKAPGALRPGRLRGLRIARRGLTAVVSWGAAGGARLYRVRVHGSDGRLLTLSTNAAHRGVTIANVLPFESFTVTVTPRGGPNLLPGPSAGARLAAAKVKRPSRRKRRSG